MVNGCRVAPFQCSPLLVLVSSHILVTAVVVVVIVATFTAIVVVIVSGAAVVVHITTTTTTTTTATTVVVVVVVSGAHGDRFHVVWGASWWRGLPHSHLEGMVVGGGVVRGHTDVVTTALLRR